MKGALTVFRKEISDYFSSKIFIILLGLIYIAGLGFAYLSIQAIKSAPLSTDQSLLIKVFIDEMFFLKLYTVGEIRAIMTFNLVRFFGAFIPLIGILFGFNAINTERNSGNISRILSQPIYRDSLINGKFLAGITTLSIMISSIILIVLGIGFRTIGVPPTSEEILRIFIFIIICIIYGTFWMALSLLFSVVMKNVAASILTAIPIWLFLTFFWPFIAPQLANQIVQVPEGASLATQLQNLSLSVDLLRISPFVLFYEATAAIVDPTLGHLALRITESDLSKLIARPLSLSQSFIQIWPQLIVIIALAIVCFAVSYIVFMKQEIRST
ncbi:MAG: ABC transporter [Actinobacteria bacterium]|nr:ABC transporter [Actinomycetota bacterium]